MIAKIVKVPQADELAPGQSKVVEADGRSIALFDVCDAFCAIDNTCTHVGGSLSKVTSKEITWPSLKHRLPRRLPPQSP